MAWLDTYPSDLLNPFKTSPEEAARLAEQAKTFPVTRLPYRGPRRHARVQFNLKRKAVSADTGIAFSDFDRIHIYRREAGAEQWVPPFADNDTHFRRVLAQSTWEHMLRHGTVPDEFVENVGELQALSAAYMESVAKRPQGQAPRRRLERVDDTVVETIIPCDEHFSNMKTHVITVQKAGGYMQRDTAVAYHSWRLRWQSPDVARELGLTPIHVRHILANLCASARRLGMEATSPLCQHFRGEVRTWRSNARTSKLPMAEELLDLVLSGKTFREIADQFGVVREDSVKGAYKHAKKVIIHQMREQGATWGEIAIRLGLLKEDQVAA